MNTPRIRAICGIGLAILSTGLSGCVSTRYALVEPHLAQPPVPINIRGAKPPVELTLSTVIVNRGPGSWKLDALWDEYEIGVVNTGEAPLVLESAALTDFQDVAVEPGDNPWTLEKQSRTQAQQLAVANRDLLRLGGGAALFSSGGAVVGVSTLIVGAPLAFSAIPALAGAPIFLGISAAKNHNRKRWIENEFTRRRLAFPVTVAPGESAHGHLFFRITPGAKTLTLRYRDGGETKEMAFNLSRLAGMHR